MCNELEGLYDPADRFVDGFLDRQDRKSWNRILKKLKKKKKNETN